MAKDAMIRFRVTEEEKEIIKQAAAIDQRNLTSFLAVVALREARKVIAEYEAANKKDGQ